MKHMNIKNIIGTALLTVFLIGCSDILEEQPRSILEPGFFKSEQGVNGGLTALYAHLRYIYGNAYYYNSGVTGTDEATYAQSADGNFKVMDVSGQGNITSTDNGGTGTLWDHAFPAVNTASGIIENATEVGLNASLIAEARFFRAFDYFMLAQTYGGVPLDMGAGELKFNTSPVRISVRNTVPQVYTKAIFPDLLKAVADLPETSRLTGTVTKNVARLFLAKAYLTYAWWLQNPNNIPTYPAADRTDPDGKNAQWYFQQAYDVATTAIDAPGSYGLMPTFYELHAGGNERNKEMMLFADHTQTSEKYNGASLTFGSGGNADNFASWMMTWNYTEIRSYKTADLSGSAVSTVLRDAIQDLGRPWTRMAPPANIFETTFANKTDDSRFDASFTTVYRGNWPKNKDLTEFYYGANGLKVYPGDAILSFLPDELGIPINYTTGAGKSNVGAGTSPGRADFVIALSGTSRVVYPGTWKMSTYRTDNAGGLGQPNAAVTRPFNIAKFSEFYFIAAEAAVKGATVKTGKSARELINVIRARAGKWKFDRFNNVAKSVDNSAAMIAATPATIDINYILAERSREYYGEGFRWFDLVRTQKWAEIAGTYKIASSTKGDHNAVTVTRNIQPYLYLRPIPQGQLDGMQMTVEEKKAYQNPGY
ncbi:MAG: RagB/SusD family nutrient uptake outer membrane protein [Bacteroidota bacterium]|nr:RagB/SusD family nutrient uptake outer membrane protein [Bacteroidota bacterium]